MVWRLEHPEFLYALLLPVAAGIGYAVSRRAGRRSLERLGRPELLRQMMKGDAELRRRRQMWRLIPALALIVAALANPQIGMEGEKVKQRSLDVIVAIDISLSMLTEDVPPNRLEKARQFARELVTVLRGERVGVVLLAGNAYPQIPLTSDFAAVDMGLRSAQPGIAPNPGTAIGDAVDVAGKLFGAQSKAGKVLVVISDGETHDEGAAARAKAASKNGVVIFCVGVGTPQGGFIPIQVAGRDDYKRDERGEPVRSRLEEDLLRDVAAGGNGRYFRLQAGNAGQIAGAIRDRIETLEKTEMEQRRFERFRSFFQLFLGAGLALLLWASWKEN